MNLSGIPQEEFERLQRIIDVDKWLASERAGHDLCGTMEWCPHCVKAEIHPCAKAKFRWQLQVALEEEAEEAPAAEAEAEEEIAAEGTAEEAPAAEAEEETAAEAAEEPAAATAEEEETAAAETEVPCAEEEACAADAAEACAEECKAADAASGRFTAEDEREAERVAEEEVAAAEAEGAEACAADAPRENEETEQALRAAAFEEIAAENIADAPAGYEYVTRFRRSFQSKLIQHADIQDFYTELKNALLGYGGVKSRLCKGSENFRVGKERIAKFCITGKTLSIYLALDPAEFEDSRYRFEDVSDKKSHAKTPMRLKVTSRRAVRRIKELLDLLAHRMELADVGCIYMDFHYAYRTDEYLIGKGLIKPYRALVKAKKQ